MLRSNSKLAISGSHGATKLVHCPDNRPTSASASEFRVVFDEDLAYFANLVDV
ncbi:hypothetical protein [Nostoc sp. NIES-3756]|uniref:hypothetical protein n=1 Tax=Nostoc sp. NIES-3756 TaxID=1751286 RepID=UPI0014953D71|nr:hypothetical protein [Nostoc sp. NIES-3756]